MHTSLRYDVLRTSRFDWNSKKEIHHIRAKSFTFYVAGAASEEIHTRVIESFEKFLKQNGCIFSRFGDGSWHDCVRLLSTKQYLYLNIPAQDGREKEKIIALYKQWKQTEYRTL